MAFPLSILRARELVRPLCSARRKPGPPGPGDPRLLSPPGPGPSVPAGRRPRPPGRLPPAWWIRSKPDRDPVLGYLPDHLSAPENRPASCPWSVTTVRTQSPPATCFRSSFGVHGRHRGPRAGPRARPTRASPGAVPAVTHARRAHEARRPAQAACFTAAGPFGGGPGAHRRPAIRVRTGGRLFEPGAPAALALALWALIGERADRVRRPGRRAGFRSSDWYLWGPYVSERQLWPRPGGFTARTATRGARCLTTTRRPPRARPLPLGRGTGWLGSATYTSLCLGLPLWERPATRS